MAPLVSSEFDAWCSPTHPRGSCSPEVGRAKPMTDAAFAAFKSLQAQLNRMAAAKKKAKIHVDGQIGPATLALYNAVSGPATLDQLAALTLASSTLVSKLSSVATSLGVPSVVAAATVTPVSQPAPPPSHGPGGEFIPPEGPGMVTAAFESLLAGDVIGFVTNPVGIALSGGIGFVAFKILSKKRYSAPAPAALTPNPWPAGRRRRRTRSRR